MKVQPPDLIILDFDGCLYPGISKVRIAIDLTLTLAIKPNHPTDRSFLPHLGLTALELMFMRLYQKIDSRITNGTLVKQYQKRLGYLPSSYVETASRNLILKLYPGALETLVFLCRRGSCGVISLALDSVLFALDTTLRSRYACSLAFYYGNPLSQFEWEWSNGPVVSGWEKREFMLREIEKRKSKIPLVIGNDVEDIPMAILAKEMGGLSIGFNPTRSAKSYFDINLYDNNWYQLGSILRGFASLGNA
ncbi:MAG: hypothetical protein HY863_09145 [Chloroflexi bacterium]|nr:hypothetical protein [Chloroflexota bacterium]